MVCLSYFITVGCVEIISPFPNVGGAMDTVLKVLVLVLIFTESVFSQGAPRPSIRSNPDFAWDKIEDHIVRGEWMMKRTQFVKTAGIVTSCVAEAIVYPELRTFGKEDTTCVQLSETFKEFLDVKLALVVVFSNNQEFQEKAKRAARQGETIIIPANQIVVWGQRNLERYEESHFSYNRLVNEVISEIYSLDNGNFKFTVD